MAPSEQKPLELILARNLLTSLATPGFLLDEQASVLFYNDAAAALLGRSFEDVGRMAVEEWSSELRPVDAAGNLIEPDRLGIAAAIRSGRPAHGEFTIRTRDAERQVAASAVPLLGEDRVASGAMVLLWPDEHALHHP